jgi:hypothetical protein
MSRLALALLVAAAATRPAPAAVDAEDLARFLPDQFNTVAVLNVRAMLASPRAEREGWGKADAKEFLAGAVPVHPSVQRIMLATEITPSRPGFGPTVGVIPLREAVDLERLAKLHGGEVTTIGEDEVVACPDDVNYLFPLADNVVGVMRTDHKPDVGKWIKHAKDSRRSPLSVYMNQSIFRSGRTNHIFVGIDTADLIGEKKARALVALSPSLKDNPDAAAIQTFLTGLRGLRFTANIRNDGIDARILVDGRVEPRFKPEAFKNLFVEVLERNGAMLEDVVGATPTIEARSVILTFKISDADLSKVLSIFSIPLHSIGDDVPVVPNEISPDATRRYFRAVNQQTENLRRRGINLDDLGRTALWHETAANRIESLSVLNVDPAAVAFGRGTAGRLHLMAASLAGLPLKGQELDNKLYAVVSPHMHGMGWGWGGFGTGQMITQTNAPQIIQKKQQLIRDDTDSRNRLWKQIDDERAKVRAALREKYSGDFGP